MIVNSQKPVLDKYDCGYRLPHSLAERYYEAELKRMQKEGEVGRPGPLAVGALWVFAHEWWSDIQQP
jgi:hypothetical protein